MGEGGEREEGGGGGGAGTRLRPGEILLMSPLTSWVPGLLSLFPSCVVVDRSQHTSKPYVSRNGGKSSWPTFTLVWLG